MHSFKSFDDFCHETSLHGWAHFNQPKNSKIARLVWILIILASFLAASYLTGRYVLNEYQMKICHDFVPESLTSLKTHLLSGSSNLLLLMSNGQNSQQ